MSKRNYTLHAVGKTEEEVNSDLTQKLKSANKRLKDSKLELLADPAKTVYILSGGKKKIKSEIGFADQDRDRTDKFYNYDQFSIEQLYKVTPDQFEALSETKKATAGENLNNRYAVKDITSYF